jgi:hypothetical protein
MSLCKIAAIAVTCLLPLAACTHQKTTSSRIPDATGTPSNGTPGGDHTGSDPSNPHNDVDNQPNRMGPSAGSPVPIPGEGSEGTAPPPVPPPQSTER